VKRTIVGLLIILGLALLVSLPKRTNAQYATTGPELAWGGNIVGTNAKSLFFTMLIVDGTTNDENSTSYNNAHGFLQPGGGGNFHITTSPTNGTVSVPNIVTGSFIYNVTHNVAGVNSWTAGGKPYDYFEYSQFPTVFMPHPPTNVCYIFLEEFDTDYGQTGGNSTYYNSVATNNSPNSNAVGIIYWQGQLPFQHVMYYYTNELNTLTTNTVVADTNGYISLPLIMGNNSSNLSIADSGYNWCLFTNATVSGAGNGFANGTYAQDGSYGISYGFSASVEMTNSANNGYVLEVNYDLREGSQNGFYIEDFGDGGIGVYAYSNWLGCSLGCPSFSPSQLISLAPFGTGTIWGTNPAPSVSFSGCYNTNTYQFH
jgi:hypothetical protein